MCARFVSRGAPFHAFHNTHKLLLVVVFAVVPWVFFGPFFSKESPDFIKVRAFFLSSFLSFFVFVLLCPRKKNEKKTKNEKKKIR